MSPKRKRTTSTSGTPLPTINTSVRFDAVPETPADSPRTTVAEGLRNLDIDRPSPFTDEQHAIPGSPSPRKRLKRNRHLVPEDRHDPSVTTSTPDATAQSIVHQPVDILLEIGETPNQAFEPPRSLQSITPTVETIRDEQANTPMLQSRRLFSPPPAFNRSPPVQPREDEAMETLAQSNDEDNVVDSATLTWQEDEITGQDIDPSADDDGEGINGIGFRPTPAIAYVRSQKRRQQVQEWKAREAREARQRRIERRRGAAAINAKNGHDVKRAVRFAEVSVMEH
ncbi:hypothetical protein LTR78_002851 [Recurvomyces mirabilis]|uniref:Uncharacterized protein n=1 Tax=Recurvomyces mirabilis TaxID=574656 RepID=A0AAE0WT24_9PEZI|nr:hypothetical protein LTR78_002851 [Recurvomyces mirabilis]KAK5159416.1 hypothetical protein LTS14_002558 [Recurvomyces mirabilis]